LLQDFGVVALELGHAHAGVGKNVVHYSSLNRCLIRC
jgi:hypothetical protein